MTMLTTPSSSSLRARKAVRNRLSLGLGRVWPAGSRLPSVRDLAHELGVAPGTAHRAIHDLVSEGLLIARPRQGIFVSESLEQLAGRTARTDGGTAATDLAGKTIDIVYHLAWPGRNYDEFVRVMVDGFKSRLADRGATFGQHAIEASDTITDIDCRSFDCDGVAIFNPGFNQRIVWSSQQAVAICTTGVEGMYRDQPGYDVVTVDQHQGGRIAGAAMRASGIQRACFIGVGSSGSRMTPAVAPYRPTSAERLQGFLAGWASAAPVDRLYARWYGEIAGAMAVQDYLKLDPRPQGIFAASDEIAVGFVTGAATHGLVAGVDYNIIGFDGQQRTRNLDGNSIASIEVPATGMGEQTADLLTSRIQNTNQPTRRVLMGCNLLSGKSLSIATAPNGSPDKGILP